MNKSIYNFTVRKGDGKEFSLGSYQGKVLLIVNTASKCGFTPQYEELQKLYAEYREKGLMILGFPCDQFAHQEPGSDEEIQNFCRVNYGVEFPIMSKIAVNGKGADPLFRFLKKQLPGKLGGGIKWNFTKFLIDRSGTPVKRFSPKTSPSDLKGDIESLLSADDNTGR